MVVTLIVRILSHFKHNFIKKYNVDNYAVWVGGDDDYLYDIPNICSTCKPIQSYLKMGDVSKLLSPYGFQKNGICTEERDSQYCTGSSLPV